LNSELPNINDFPGSNVKIELSLPVDIRYISAEPVIEIFVNLKYLTSDFTNDEIGMLRDGLDWIVEYQEGVVSDDYIAAVKRLAMKLDKVILQK
jgi:hypothetical protein